MWKQFSRCLPQKWPKISTFASGAQLTIPKSLRKPRWRGYSDDPEVNWFIKTAIWLLRHDGRREGLNILPDGFLNVSELLTHPKFQDFDLDKFIYLARRDPQQRIHFKSQRYALLVRCEGINIPLVRHTTRPIAPYRFPELVYYSNLSNWPTIRDEGLSVNPEHHTPIIFLRQRFPEMDDFRVDHTRSQIIIVIDVVKAASDGIKFFRRTTQEIVTPGDDYGRLRPRYFKHVMVRKWTKDILLHPISGERGLMARDT